MTEPAAWSRNGPAPRSTPSSPAATRAPWPARSTTWWIWLPLCVLFLAPFVDPRRPLRLIHLDLLALLGFSASLFFFNKAEIGRSVGLVYPVLAYVFLRMLVAGLRPSETREPLLPLARRSWLVAGIVVLAAVHTFYIATEGKVIDVGLAGVIGADRLTHGEDVYGPGLLRACPRSDGGMSTARSITWPTSPSSRRSPGAAAGTTSRRRVRPRSASSC